MLWYFLEFLIIDTLVCLLSAVQIASANSVFIDIEKLQHVCISNFIGDISAQGHRCENVIACDFEVPIATEDIQILIFVRTIAAWRHFA